METSATDTAEQTQDVSVADLLSANDSATSTATDTVPSDAATDATGGADAAVDSQAVETSAPTLKDRVAELGFADVADDNEAQQRLIDAYAQQREQQAQIQQQMEMLRFQMQMAQQGAQGVQPAQQTQSAQATQQAWFNAPKTNEQLRQQFIAGKAEDGSVQWKPNTPPQLIAEYEAEQAFYADWANKLVRDPVNALAGFKAEVLAEAQKQAQQFIEQQARRQQAESFVEQQIREHEDVFYQKDPVTKAIRRDFQGREMLTEAGVRFESILGELEAAGLTDETARWKYALQSYKAQYGDLKQQAADKMAQARAGHATKAAAATHIAQRNGQEAVGATNGRRQQSDGLGSRLFANPEFANSIRW